MNFSYKLVYYYFNVCYTILMTRINLRLVLTLIILVSFMPTLKAEDKRIIPLDIYLIIDGSESLKNSKNEALSWINEQVVDRILMDGDKITILAAGDRSRVIYSETVSGSAGKQAVKEKLQALETGGKKADFSGALREAASKISQVSRDRLPLTMLITASAEGLEPVLKGNSQSLLRWFRSEKFQRWQVLIVAPDIGKKVQEAAAAYMSSVR